MFQYRYLLVDLPSGPESSGTMHVLTNYLQTDSRVRRPTRLVVESGHNFSERDGIFMWQ